ncbi:MAG TPA: class I SAM-dependent methyltransferase, partial [Gemmatimonadota bacterium]|nr:class I SAM-dependent methyltransferase [Gemmatimonadota bacterium]
MDREPWSRFWEKKEDLGRVYPSSPAVLQALVRHLGDAPARVLEIGSGTGRDTAALAARGHSAIALDASLEALALTAQAAPDLVGRGIVAGDAFHLPFPDRAFDAVFHQGVLEHFGNPAAFLAENLRVTTPGGLLVVDVPQRWHPWTALKRVAIRVDRWFAGWETEYSIDELEELARQAGFEVVESYGDTMVPSLAYRLLREGAKRCSVDLPLRPAAPPVLRDARERLRARLLAPRAARWIAHTIGVVARR